MRLLFGISFASLLMTVLTVGVVFAADGADGAGSTCPAPIVLFNGENLDGWEGGAPGMWRVEDEAIVGGSLEQRIEHNDFLCTTREFSNFELRMKVKLIGADVNAGVQVRSRRVPGSHEVSGYQADLGQRYWGCIYDESRRGKLLAEPDRVELEKHIDRDGWNEYVIRCDGPRIRLWLNGYQTVDYTEAEEGIEREGIIGLQVHAGAPSEAWYKDITLVELPAPAE